MTDSTTVGHVSMRRTPVSVRKMAVWCGECVRLQARSSFHGEIKVVDESMTGLKSKLHPRLPRPRKRSRTPDTWFHRIFRANSGKRGVGLP
jgi:hypothetical protein